MRSCLNTLLALFFLAAPILISSAQQEGADDPFQAKLKECQEKKKQGEGNTTPRYDAKTLYVKKVAEDPITYACSICKKEFQKANDKKDGCVTDEAAKADNCKEVSKTCDQNQICDVQDDELKCVAKPSTDGGETKTPDSSKTDSQDNNQQIETGGVVGDTNPGDADNASHLLTFSLPLALALALCA